MSRTIPLLGIALLIVALGLVAAFVIFNDSRSPDVNAAREMPECGPAHSDAGNPLDGEPRRQPPAHDDEVVAPDVTPGQQLVVAGSVTATAGVLPATLSVTAQLPGADPIVVELRGESEFRIPVSDAGSYALTAEADSWYQLAPVRIDAAPDARAELQIAPAALLNGRVDGSDGSVLPGAKVQLISGGNVIGETATDAGGRYTLRELRPSAYRVKVIYGDNTAVNSAFLVVGDNTEDLTVETGTKLCLKLVDDQDNPVTASGGDVGVYIYRNYSPTGSGVPADVSSRPGELIWLGLKDGARYMLDIQVPGFAQKYESFDVKGSEHDQTIKLERGGNITGEVVMDGEIETSLFHVRLQPKAVGVLRATQLDENNRFELNSIALGDYELQLMDVSSNRVIEKQDVTIDGGTQNVVFKIDPGPTLTIELVDEDGKPTPGYLVIRNGDGDQHWLLVDETGLVTFAFLQAADYEVTVMPRTQDYAQFRVTVPVSEGANRQRIALRRPDCIRVTYVYPGSNAEAAGLQANDLMLSFSGQAVATLQGLQELVASMKEGETLTMTVIRDGKEQKLNSPNWHGSKLGVAGVPAVNN